MASIRVRNLGKKYMIGRGKARAGRTLRDSLGETLAGFRFGKRKRDSQQEFWALQDVDFDVPQGQVVGIIGRNGAGKSTLLKLLSRITEPTTGSIEYHGRMSSLLEVGTGFHPELTGRENIFLNGAILGMTRDEIEKKFDEIVAFSEIEQFLETPVKRYSSGMYMRLAFAVAAHVDPEIMIIDEVLAVGDVSFQRKCLGRMEQMAGTGRTVLFVSHNIPAIKSLCQRVVVLKEGRVIEDSTEVSKAISTYAELAHGTSVWTRAPGEVPSDACLIFSRVELWLKGEQPNHRLVLRAELSSIAKHRAASVAIDIFDSSLTAIMQAIPEIEPFIEYAGAQIILELEVELPPMIPGTYRVMAWVGPHNTITYDQIPPLLEFQIESNPDPRRTFAHAPDHGFIVPRSSVFLQTTS